MEAPTNTETTVCNKHDILLRRNKNLNNYKLLFQAKNTNIQIGNLINFKLYELLGTLNKDIIESIKVINVHSSTMMDFLLIFKRFGAEVGISKKYMFIRTQRLQHEGQTEFISQVFLMRERYHGGANRSLAITRIYMWTRRTNMK